MRRRTGWALGGMLAGTVLLGATGTLATFTDSETLAVTAGAGRMALLPTPQTGQKVQINPEATIPVVPDVQGSGTAVLRMSAEGTHAQDPCATDVVLTVTLPQRTDPVTGRLCTFAGEGRDLLTVGTTTPALTLTVRAAPGTSLGSRADQWTGDLRLTLVQSGGTGFRDDQRIPVHVVVANAQGDGGRANGGSG